MSINFIRSLLFGSFITNLKLASFLNIVIIKTKVNKNTCQQKEKFLVKQIEQKWEVIFMIRYSYWSDTSQRFQNEEQHCLVWTLPHSRSHFLSWTLWQQNKELFHLLGPESYIGQLTLTNKNEFYNIYKKILVSVMEVD